MSIERIRDHIWEIITKVKIYNYKFEQVEWTALCELWYKELDEDTAHEECQRRIGELEDEVSTASDLCDKTDLEVEAIRDKHDELASVIEKQKLDIEGYQNLIRKMSAEIKRLKAVNATETSSL